MTQRKVNLLMLIVITTITIIFLLLGGMAWLSRPPRSVAPAALAVLSPTITSSAASCDSCSVPELAPTVPLSAPEEIVATINQQTITAHTWQLATQLDAVMSQLAQRPVPTAEETLDRLVNETLVLQAVPMSEDGITAAEVTAKLATLTRQWQLTDAAVDQALARVGLSRLDLTQRVRHLLQVEAALQRLTQQQGDVNTWLAKSRASAEIGLYNAIDRPAPPVAVAPPIATVTVPTPPPDLPISPYASNLAPEFTLPQLDGSPITLSHLRGQPTIINFWATWCPPCRSELPTLQAAYQKYQGKIGFVAVDVKEDAATVSAFVQSLGLTFPIALDADGSVSDRAYEVLGIPTTLFVDERGVVSYRHVGPLDEATLEGYLTPLLGLSSIITPTQPPTQTQTQTSNSNLTLAPTFTLTAADGQLISLADYRAKQSVVLVFYRGHT